MEISTDEKFASSLHYLKRRVGGEIIETGARMKLVIDNINAKNIVDALSDIIVTDCKSYYIESRIKLPVDDEIGRRAFIKALATFDRDTDKVIAKTLIKLSPCFHLDSFYEFMLDILKSRWNEVCLLANENVCYLACKKTFTELLHFLISNIENKSDREELLTMISHLPR